MFSLTQILLLIFTFLTAGLAGFIYIYYLRLNKISYDKILLLLAAGLKILFICSFAVAAVYFGKFVKFHGIYSLLLISAAVIIISPALFSLWKKKIPRQFIHQFKIR